MQVPFFASGASVSVRIPLWSVCISDTDSWDVERFSLNACDVTNVSCPATDGQQVDGSLFMFATEKTYDRGSQRSSYILYLDEIKLRLARAHP